MPTVLFVEITICPVNKYPVACHALHHAIIVSPSQYILHKRFHPRIQLPDKLLISRIHIIVVHTQEPVKSIIHDGVNMRSYRILSSLLPDGTLYSLRIKEQIVVHQITLNSISTPYPAITFDTINEKLPSSKMHRISTYLPNSI